MKIGFLSAAILATQVSIAATPIDGWYSSIFGGGSYVPDNISASKLGRPINHAAYYFGYNAGGRVGFQSNPLRYEGEVTYIAAKLKRYYINRVLRTRVAGQTTATMAMANVYYDFPNMLLCIQPFLGVGLGYAWVDGQLNSSGPFSFPRYKGGSSVFAYQGTAGFTYNFAENYALNIAYRYVGTERVSHLGKVFQGNLGTIGVIYRFDESSYK